MEELALPNLDPNLSTHEPQLYEVLVNTKKKNLETWQTDKQETEISWLNGITKKWYMLPLIRKR